MFGKATAEYCSGMHDVSVMVGIQQTTLYLHAWTDEGNIHSAEVSIVWKSQDEGFEVVVNRPRVRKTHTLAGSKSVSRLPPRWVQDVMSPSEPQGP